jgi:RNA polymerase sigma factor (sigma-70 family)
MPSDAELVQAARNGDPSGLGALLQRYRPRLYAIALAMLGHGAAAQDAVQETCLIALEKLPQLRDPAAVGGWLHATLRNCCRMALRARRGEVSVEALPGGLPDTAADSLAGARLERLALRDWIWHALGTLPEALRVTALLRYFGSYPSYAELAAILGVPVGTVRSRLAQAKLRLADALLAEAGLADPEARRDEARREAYYREAFHDLYERGARDAFLAHYEAELALVFDGLHLQGREHWAAEMDGDCDTGSRVLIDRVLASGNVTVLEARNYNPPEHAGRCPPAGTAVLFHRAGRTHRLHLYQCERPPVEPD